MNKRNKPTRAVKLCRRAFSLCQSLVYSVIIVGFSAVFLVLSFVLKYLPFENIQKSNRFKYLLLINLNVRNMNNSLPYQIRYSNGNETCTKCCNQIRSDCIQMAIMIQVNPKFVISEDFCTSIDLNK